MSRRSRNRDRRADCHYFAVVPALFKNDVTWETHFSIFDRRATPGGASTIATRDCRKTFPPRKGGQLASDKVARFRRHLATLPPPIVSYTISPVQPRNRWSAMKL